MRLALLAAVAGLALGGCSIPGIDNRNPSHHVTGQASAQMTMPEWERMIADYGETIKSPMAPAVMDAATRAKADATMLPSILPMATAPISARFLKAATPPKPYRHIFLSWDASDPGSIYRVHGSNTLSNPRGWPVLLTTNGLSCVFSNDLRPGRFFYRMTASNANTLVERVIAPTLR